MPPHEYDGKQFEVRFYNAETGDAGIWIEANQRTCIVKGLPGKVTSGQKIYITGFYDGRGKVDFAKYSSGPGDVTSEVKTADSKISVEDRVKTEPDKTSDVYILYLGPTSKQDDCAIAVVPAEVLGMGRYNALVHLVKQYDNNTIFKTTTDRRIVRGLWDQYIKAEKAKGLDELCYTMNSEPVTPANKETFRDYFKLDNDKMRASGTVTEADKKTAQETVKKNLVTPVKPDKKKIFRGKGTQVVKGGPGGGLESILP